MGLTGEVVGSFSLIVNVAVLCSPRVTPPDGLERKKLTVLSPLAVLSSVMRTLKVLVTSPGIKCSVPKAGM